MIGSLAGHLEKSCELERARRFAQRRHVCIKVAVSIRFVALGDLEQKFSVFVFLSLSPGLYRRCFSNLFPPPPGDAMEAEPAPIKTAGQLLAGSSSFS